MMKSNRWIVPLLGVALAAACSDGDMTYLTRGGKRPAPICRGGDRPNDSALVRARDDIGIRTLVTPPSKVVRLAQDPLSSRLFYLDVSGDIHVIDIRPGTGSTITRAFSSGEIAAAAGLGCRSADSDVVEHSFQGFVFGPDGAMYLTGNCINRTERNSRGAVLRGRTDAGETSWTIVAITEPYPDSNTSWDHHFNGIAVSPDGKWLYVNSGSRTDHGEVQDNGGAFPGAREVPLTSAMFRLSAAGSGIVLPADEQQLRRYLFADGLRNAFDPAFRADGKLFSGENGPDADYSEEINWLRPGRHYGFPWQLGTQPNAQQFSDYDPATDYLLQVGVGFTAIDEGYYHNDPGFPESPGRFTGPVASDGPDFDEIRQPDGSIVDASDEGGQAHSLTAHLSPLGLTFDVQGSLCGEFHQSGFIAMFGAAAGNLGVEPALAHLELTRRGRSSGYTATVTELVGGFTSPIDSVLIGTKLYVADFGGLRLPTPGDIYELSLPEPEDP